MFGHSSYIGYTLLFCLPPLLLIWLRREFSGILVENLPRILLATALLTVYGCLIWPIALSIGAWSYGADKITNFKLFGWVYLDDVVWWFLISLLFSSFVCLSAHYEKRSENLLLREIKALVSSFQSAFQGLRMITLERNSTIHVAVAVFVLMEGFFLRITLVEWLFVLAAIGIVLGLELMNSAIERLAARRVSQPDEEIRLIKDAAAAGVLIASAMAAVIGVFIFMSRIIAAL